MPSTPCRLAVAVWAGTVALCLGLAARAATLEGSAAYRERIAVPADATFEVTIEDAGRADAPSTVIARQRIDNAGLPPYRFKLDYDDSTLGPGSRPVVRATLRHQGELLFTTDTVVPLPAAGSAPLRLRLVSARPRRPAAALPPLPSSFVGEVPGAGGPVRWQVDLLPGRRFQSRQTFVGRPEPNRFDDIGRWRLDGGQLELRGTRDLRPRFEPTADGALRLLDGEGRRIDSASGHNDLLARLPQPAPIEPRVVATGMFRYFADAPSIVLCADRRRLPVAMAGDYLALERAYSAAAQGSPGQPLLVSVDGSIAARVGAEESLGPVPTLVVERFGKVWPRESCGQPLVDSPLRRTHWKLTRLNGEPATVAAQQSEPYLAFDAGQPRVAGSGGCNRVMGGFELDGASLRLTQMAGTMMACPQGMAQERAFLDALGQVTAWQVRGSHLELFDAQRRVLARFEAVARR